MKNVSKKNILIFVLIVVLVFLTSYVVFDKLQERKQNQLLDAFQQGANYGYEQAVASIFTESQNCATVPVYYDNKTINLIEVDCLQ